MVHTTHPAVQRFQFDHLYAGRLRLPDTYLVRDDLGVLVGTVRKVGGRWFGWVTGAMSDLVDARRRQDAAYALWHNSRGCYRDYRLDEAPDAAP